MSVPTCCIYEQDAIRRVAGATIRPGGLGITERALELLNLPATAQILDVGCGTGMSVEYLIARQYKSIWGLDASTTLLQAGRQRNSTLSLLQARGGSLPLANDSLDAVLMECSLSVMPDTRRALAEIERTLKTGGVLVINDLYTRNPNSIPGLQNLPMTSCINGALSKPLWYDLLHNQGFEVQHWEDHNEALRQFVFSIIMTHGSLTNFWCSMIPEGMNAEAVQAIVSQAKLSYFLAVCVKSYTETHKRDSEIH